MNSIAHKLIDLPLADMIEQAEKKRWIRTLFKHGSEYKFQDDSTLTISHDGVGVKAKEPGKFGIDSVKRRRFR